MQVSKFKTTPVIIDDIYFGDVVKGKYSEFIISREQSNFYRNCPCKCKNSMTLDKKELNDVYKSRCEGFTVRCDAVHDAEKKGAIILKVNFLSSKKLNKLDTYIILISKFEESATTPDNTGKKQYARALHDFIQVE